jgi:lipopolysaccharide transport system permease protein
MATVSDTQQFPAFHGLLRLWTRHRHLTLALARREITDRYVGQMLGFIWAVGHPLLLMAVYIFIFGYVFKVKVGGTLDLPLDYTVYILTGLIPWLMVNECLNKGCGTIVGNSNLVKQVVFPLEVLPVKGVLATLFPQTISLGILVLYVLISSGSLPWTYALLPVAILLQVVFVSGIVFALAALSPFFRDLKDFIQMFSVVGIYLVPVVFLPDMVPGVFRPFLYVNPFSYLVWCFQDLCYYGRFEHPWAWAVLAGLSIGSYAAGYRLFARLKPYFGNVL